MKIVLVDIQLLTMVMKMRLIPISTSINISGYTSVQKISRPVATCRSAEFHLFQDYDNELVPQQQIIMKPDDLAMWAHDKNRLLAVVKIVFDDSLLTLALKEILEENPIEAFSIIINKVVGQMEKFEEGDCLQ